MRAIERCHGPRWRALAICILLSAPFLIVSIPPLSDVPGHIAAAAVAGQVDSDPLFRQFFDFAWYPIPNLGADMIVALLRETIGITRAYWLVAALIPALLGCGLVLTARSLNPRGGAAVAWSLLFIYSYPFNYGFLNYMLGVALALVALASIIRLEGHKAIQAAATLAVLPLLFVCHAVAGCLFALLCGSRELIAWRDGEHDFGGFVRQAAPLALLPAMILVWRLHARSFEGRNVFAIKPKLNALVMLLRDQNLFLDIGTVVLAAAVFGYGWSRGALPHRSIIPALLVLILAFLAVPPSFGGSDFADMRLLPLIPMLAFATQDWRPAGSAAMRRVAMAGYVLLAVRLAVTAAGFVQYQARYDIERGALAFIPDRSRVLVLNMRNCDALRHWRASRLNHFGDLAIAYRKSWTNSQWDRDGGQLITVKYRPSPTFYNDPSQYVWPVQCGGMAAGRPTMHDALANVPFDGIDYLWLIDTRTPPGYRNDRLLLRWQSAESALYRIAAKAALRRPATRIDRSRS